MAKKILKPIRPPYTSKAFFSEDYTRTLFPLRTNKVLSDAGFSKMLEFARGTSATDPSEVGTTSFLPQKRVFAMKSGGHLRRTVKLDPAAEIFLYDLVYRNRNLFRKPVSLKRECYGYRFENGSPIDATSSYRAFKGAAKDHAKNFKYG